MKKQIKRKKPNFVRQDIHKKKKLEKKWRKPKGWHSKMRQGKRGQRKSVSTGYGTPREIKNLTKDGLKSVHIFSIRDKLPEKGCIVISSGLGQKKRIEIVKLAEEKGIKVSNIKDIAAYLKKAEESMAARKEKKLQRKKKREEKKVKKKKEDLTDKISEEEQKEKQKKEKDKLLTKRDI